MRLAWLLLLCCTSAAVARETPNVLFIVADDLRAELGCYGRDSIKSPNIDKLAARGVVFQRAYCQYPVCNPSRTSFLTGLRPDSTRVLDNSAHFRKTIPDVVTLPQHFRANGYKAFSLGKVFHRGLTMEDTRAEMDDRKSWDSAEYFKATPRGDQGEGRNLTAGKLPWCRWLAAEGDDEDQPDGQIARRAIELLEQNKDKPFFLAVGFHKPHDPFIAPKKYFDLYPPEKLKLPVTPAGLNDPADAIGGGGFKVAFDKFTDKERLEFMRAYYAGASFIDAQIGRVLDALDRLKLTQKTIVVFLGDHGYHLGERGWWNKNTLYELSARAPLIIADPGRSIGKTCPRVVEFLDLYPTLAEVCGLPVPSHLEGKSLRVLLDDPQAAWDRVARTQVVRGKTMGRTVRDERWRYTEWDEGRRGVELYDHDNDPQEHRNLATNPDFAEQVKKMKALLLPPGRP